MMNRRKAIAILAGAVLGGAAIGVPIATTYAQSDGPWPNCPMTGQQMGWHWGGSGTPAASQGAWGGPMQAMHGQAGFGMMGRGPGAGSWMGQAGATNQGQQSYDFGRHFIEEMIPHHEDAIQMAGLALQRAEHQELRDLAASIEQVQRDEIAQMRQWYQDWYGTEPGPSRMEQMMPNRPGHDPSALENAEQFDKAFIEQMVQHHQMAVMMTGHMAAGVQQPELQALMASMGQSQAAEIQQMQGWYQSWYGGAPASPGNGPGVGPRFGPGPHGPMMGPGMGPGMHPGMGPGMGPGMHPGMYPGTGPGPNQGPRVQPSAPSN
ncbi:MAG: DUF305 domain-containing protein [Chloroflexi bacterium]|nr:DUF305 domain-containing protein [Chloroflexota bacterium]